MVNKTIAQTQHTWTFNSGTPSAILHPPQLCHFSRHIRQRNLHLHMENMGPELFRCASSVLLLSFTIFCIMFCCFHLHSLTMFTTCSYFHCLRWWRAILRNYGRQCWLYLNATPPNTFFDNIQFAISMSGDLPVSSTSSLLDFTHFS